MRKKYISKMMVACVFVLVAMLPGLGSAAPPSGVFNELSVKIQFAASSVAEMKKAQETLPPGGGAIPFHPETHNQIGLPPNQRGSSSGQATLATGVNNPAPIVFNGLGDTGWIPPDTQGAAGPAHLMETINGGVAFYDKGSGALISETTLQAFWSRFGTAAGQPDYFSFDPRVQYDQYNGRFIVTSDGNGSTTPSSAGSWILIAVSATSDPTGNWYEWALPANSDDPNSWPDYPTLGIDGGHIYIAANMFDNSNTYHQGDVLVVPEAPLLSGNPNPTLFKKTGVLAATTQPAHEYGNSANEYFASDSGNQRLLLSQVSFDNSGNPIWSNLGYIQVAPYGYGGLGLPEAPQLGSAQLIETGDTRLQNAVFRNGYLWTTHTVADVGNTKDEVAWYELDPAVASFTTPGTPVQQGQISDPTRFYYYPSIAVNSSGDAAIGFSGSSSSDYAGAYYTARNASDPAGMTQTVSLLKGGLAPYYKTFGPGRNRWGDYSATVVDPSDDLGFWTLQEYASSPSGGIDQWGTWWGRLTPAVNPNYYWTWYDSTGTTSDWVLLANPAGATNNLNFGLSIAGVPMTLSNGGVVGPGTSISSNFTGVKGGPVEASSFTGGTGITSQRALWASNSLEEVLGTDQARISNHYYWPWYDSTGTTSDWVTLSNPGSSSIYYEVKLSGQLETKGTLNAKDTATPIFSGVRGGLLDVQAWADSSKTISANVNASQRVLTNNGSAFNEVPGIPQGELSDRYLWTWYDMKSVGASDWVVIVNPGVNHSGNPQGSVTAHIKIAGTTYGPYTIAAGANVTPTFPNVMGGPVEIWTDSGDVIVTQRSLIGPSFEEVPGTAASTSGGYTALANANHWTWYDQKTPGMSDWVMIANPNASAVTNVTIKIAGNTVWQQATLNSGQNVTPTFPGTMGGPVEVDASGPVIASQRVLYNGYFNEVLGTVLN